MELISQGIPLTPSPVQSLCYIPQINTVVSSSKDGYLRLYDALTGSLIRTSPEILQKKHERILLQYFEHKEAVVVACGSIVNVRRHIADALLISDILLAPIKDHKDHILLELNSEQTSLFENALLCDPRKRQALEECGVKIVPPDDRFPKMSEWRTMLLEGPYDILISCVQHMMRTPQVEEFSLMNLAASIKSRLIRLILPDELLISLNFWKSSVILNVEQYRRISFCIWPHMDYQWATPEAMAAAGFYMTSRDVSDRAFCYMCGICLTNWEPTDEPWSEHNRHSASCTLVQSKPSSNVPIADSWSTETARKQDISTLPIEVLGTGFSKEFILTSTRTGDVTVWDVSVFLRKTLDFKLIDLLTSICERPIQSEEVQVDSACLLRPSSLTQPAFVSSKSPIHKPGTASYDPTEHHVILGCRLSSTVVTRLRAPSDWCPERCRHPGVYGTDQNVSETNSERSPDFQSCLLIVRVYPVNAMGLMVSLGQTRKLRDASIVSAATADLINNSLLDKGFIPPDFDLPLAEEYDENYFVPACDVPSGVEEEFESDCDCFTASVDGTGDGDHLQPLTTGSNEHDVENDNARRNLTMSQALHFYKTLGLDHLVDGHLMDVLGSAEILLHPNETRSDPFVAREAHPSQSPTVGKRFKNFTTANHYKPRLIEVVTLPTPTANRIIQLLPIPTPIDATNDEHQWTATTEAATTTTKTQRLSIGYSKGLLVCIGSSRELDSTPLNENTSAVDEIGNEGDTTGPGLFLYGYDPFDSNRPLLSTVPIAFATMTGIECPRQVCLLNADSQPTNATDDLSSGDRIETSDYDPVDSYDNQSTSLIPLVYTQCLVLTECSRLYQVDLFLKPTKSHHKRCLLFREPESEQSFVPFTCLTYCEESGIVCLGDAVGQVLLYRHRLRDSSPSDARSVTDGLTEERIMDTAGSLTMTDKKLLAFAPNPLDYLITLGRLTQTCPLDQRTRTCLNSTTAWVEIDLSQERSHTSLGHDIPVGRGRRRKASVFCQAQNAFGLQPWTSQPPNLNGSSGIGVTSNETTVNTGECETVKVISRFVTRQLMTKPDSDGRGPCSSDTSSTIVSRLDNATLTVQLALAGGPSTRIWETKHKRTASVFKSAAVIPCSTNQTGSPKSPVSTDARHPTIKVLPESIASGAESIIEISLPQTCSLSHFGLHLALSDIDITELPDVYVTLLRINIPTTTRSSLNPYHVASSIHTSVDSTIDPDLMVNDLQAPFIDDEAVDSLAATSDLTNDVTSVPGVRAVLAAFHGHPSCIDGPHIDIPTRFWNFGRADPLPPNRLRELGGDIVAGPYAVNPFLDRVKRTAFIPLTSPELIKCRSRLFAIHMRIMPYTSRNNRFYTSDREESNSESDCSSDLLPLWSLDELFSLIGLTVHRFVQPALWSALDKVPTSSEPVINANRTVAPSLRTNLVPHERAQRLALIRSTKLHATLIDWLASPVCQRQRAVGALHSRQALHCAIDLLTWIVNMYNHEMHWPHDILRQLFHCAAASCCNLLENLLVHADRQVVQMGTALFFSLLNLESWWVHSDSQLKPSFHISLLHSLLHCTSIEDSIAHDSRLSRYLLAAQCASGVEALINLFSVLVRDEYDTLTVELSRAKIQQQVSETLAELLRTLVQVMERYHTEQNASVRLPQLREALQTLRTRYGLLYHDFGNPSLFDLRLSQWTHLGPNALISNRILRTEHAAKKSKVISRKDDNNNELSNQSNTNNNTDEAQIISTLSQLEPNKPEKSTVPSAIDGPGLSKHYTNFLAGANIDASTDGNLVRPRVSYLSALGEGRDNMDDEYVTRSPLFPLAEYQYVSDSELFYADLITLLRDSGQRHSIPVHLARSVGSHWLLPELQDWPARGLLDVEPLRVTEDEKQLHLPADCVLERVNMFTGVPLGSFNCDIESSGSSEVDGSTVKTRELMAATKHLTSPPEAYHLLITRMHAGAHRSVILAFHSPDSLPSCRNEPIHLLTDLFIPAHPYLACVTVEALASQPLTPDYVTSSGSYWTCLVAVTTQIARRALVLRDLSPPVPFTRLRITISAGLDCLLTRARVHLGAFFGRSGLLDCLDFEATGCLPPRSWEIAWAASRPLFVAPSKLPLSDDSVNQTLIAANPLLNQLERSMSSALAALNLTQSELTTWLTKECGLSGGLPLQSHIAECQRDRHIFTLYTRYWNLRCQLNWLQRVSDRLVRIAYPALEDQLQTQARALTSGDLVRSLSVDKARVLSESLLTLLVAHTECLSYTLQSGSTDSKDSSLIGMVELNEIIRSLLRSNMFHGTRAMQVMSVGVLSPLLGLWYSRHPVDSYHLTDDADSSSWLFELMSSTLEPHVGRCPDSRCLCCTRAILSFWSLIQRLLRYGFSDHLLITCMHLIRSCIRRTDPYQSERQLMQLLILFDVIWHAEEHKSGGSYYGTSTRHATRAQQTLQTDFFNKLINAMDTIRAAQPGTSSTGWHGLLAWYYARRAQRPVTLRWDMDSDEKDKDSWSSASPFVRYECARAMYYRWRVHRLSEQLNRFSAQRNERYQNIVQEKFPLGALFTERLMELRILSLMRHCIPSFAAGGNPAAGLDMSVTGDAKPVECDINPCKTDKVPLSAALVDQITTTVQALLHTVTSTFVPQSSTFEPETFPSLMGPQLFFGLCSLIGRLVALLQPNQVRAVFFDNNTQGSSLQNCFLYRMLRRLCAWEIGSGESKESLAVDQILMHGLSLILGSSALKSPLDDLFEKPLNTEEPMKTTKYSRRYSCLRYQPNATLPTSRASLQISSLWSMYCSQLPVRLPHQTAWALLCDGDTIMQPDFRPISDQFKQAHASGGVLWSLMSDCVNELLSRSSVDCHVTDSVNLEHALTLYLNSVGEAYFEPKIFTPLDEDFSNNTRIETVVLNENVLLHVLDEVNQALMSPAAELDGEPERKPAKRRKMELSQLSLLALRFLASAASTSDSTCQLLIGSPKFVRLFDVLLERTDFQSLTASRVGVHALEVLFTCLAFSRPASESSASINPFDKFCVETLIKFLGPPITSREQRDGGIVRGPWTNDSRLVALQDLLLIATCERLKNTDEQQHCTTAADLQPPPAVCCAPHTIRLLDPSLRCELAVRVLAYLHRNWSCSGKIPPSELICFSTRSTLFDMDFEVADAKLAIWTLEKPRQTSADCSDTSEHSLCENIRRITCCLFTGRVSSSTPEIPSATSSQRTNQPLLLSRIFYQLVDSLQADCFPSHAFIRYLFDFCLDLLSASRVPQSICRMVTVASLIGGWTTLAQFTTQLFTGLYPSTVNDWLLSSLYLLLTKHSWARNQFLLRLNRVGSPGVLSCSLLLLLAFCYTETADRSYQMMKSAVDMFLNQSNINPLKISTGFQMVGDLSSPLHQPFGCGASELAQALITHHGYMGSSRLTVPSSEMLLNQSIPAGLSAPLASFGQVSFEYWKHISQLPGPSPVRQTSYQSAFSPSWFRTFNNQTASQATIQMSEFSDVSWFHSDLAEGELNSLTAALLTRPSKQICNQPAVFPLYLGSLSKWGVDQINEGPSKRPLAWPGTAVGPMDRIMEKQDPRLILHTEHSGATGPVNITVRFPCLIWLQLIKLHWSMDDDKYQGPSGALIEFYRTLPGSTRQALVGTLSEVGFQPGSRIPTGPLKLSDNVTKDHSILQFDPCLVTHLILRLYRSSELSKTLALTELYLYGSHVEDEEWSAHKLASLTPAPSTPTTTLLTSPIALIHVIHNHLISSGGLPFELITPTLVDRLLWPLIAASLQTYTSTQVSRLASVVACRHDFRTVVCELCNFTCPGVNSDGTAVPVQSESSLISGDWLDAFKSEEYQQAKPITSWIDTPFTVILAEHVLERFMTAVASGHEPSILPMLDHVLARILFDDELISTVRFPDPTQQTDSDWLDITDEHNKTCSVEFGPMAWVCSNPSQRLFTWLCLHNDRGQSRRLIQVLRWVRRLCSMPTASLSDPLYSRLPLVYATSLLTSLASVLWTLGDQIANAECQLELNDDLACLVHSMCMHVLNYLEPHRHHQFDYVDTMSNMRSFARGLRKLLCALCALRPKAAVRLFTDLIQHRPDNRVWTDSEFAHRLWVMAWVTRSEPVVRCLRAEVPCPLTECCQWLGAYFADTGSDSMDLAIRRMQVLTCLLQPRQPDSLREHVSHLVSHHVLAAMFDHFATEFRAGALRSIYSRQLSNVAAVNISDQLRLAAVSLCQALMHPLRSSIAADNSTPISANEPQQHLANLIATRLDRVVTEREANIPDFVQCLMLEALNPVKWVHRVAVFAVPGLHETQQQILDPLTGPPFISYLSRDRDSSDVSSFVSAVHHNPWSYCQALTVHPALSRAFLLMKVEDSSSELALPPSKQHVVCVGHLRVTIFALLHPFVRLSTTGSSVVKFASSVEMARLSSFDMAVTGRLPEPGQSFDQTHWDEALMLPQGACDHWTVEQLVHLVHGTSRTGFEPLILLVRPRLPDMHRLPAPSLSWEKMASQMHLSTRPTDPISFSFPSLLVRSGVIRSLANCVMCLLYSHVDQQSHDVKHFYPEPNGQQVCDITDGTVLQYWLQSLSENDDNVDLTYPPFSPMSELPTISAKPYRERIPFLSEGTFLRTVPMHSLLVSVLLLRLDGYAESLANVTTRLATAIDQSHATESGQPFLLGTSTCIIADLLKLILKLAQAPLSTESWRLEDSIGTSQEATISDLSDRTCDKQSLRPLPFEALHGLYNQLSVDTSSDDLTRPQIGWQHVENGILDLILSFLSTLVLRSTKRPDAAGRPLPGQTNLVQTARLEFERELISLTNLAACQATETSQPQTTSSTPSTYLAKGTGFSFGGSESRWNSDVVQVKLAREDSYATMLFHTLASFLKAFCGAGDSRGSMCSSPLIPNIAHTLAKFDLVRVLVTYLRNDSALDLDSRIPLYRTLFLLLRVIARVPGLHWILVTGSTETEVMVNAAVAECIATLDTFWLSTEAASVASAAELTVTSSLPDSVPRDCPARFLNDIYQLLLVYEKQLNKLGFSGPDAKPHRPPTTTGPTTGRGSRCTLVRQKSVRYRNYCRSWFKRGSTVPQSLFDRSSAQFGAALVQACAPNSFQSTKCSASKSTEDHEESADTVTAKDPFDLLQETDKPFSLGLLQLHSGFLDISDQSASASVNPEGSSSSGHEDIRLAEPMDYSDPEVDSEEEDEQDDKEGAKRNQDSKSDGTIPFADSAHDGDNDELSSLERHQPKTSTSDKTITPIDAMRKSEQLHVMLSELSTTVTLVGLAVNAFYRARASLRCCAKTEPETGLQLFLGQSNLEVDGDDKGKKDEQNNNQSGSSGPTASDLSRLYCDRLRPLQFGMLEMLSNPMNGTVHSIVPHHFSEIVAQFEGLRLIQPGPGALLTVLWSDKPTDFSSSAAGYGSGGVDGGPSTSISHGAAAVSGPSSLFRARRLAQEIVTLSTGLPLSEHSSVFVRADENHVSMLKALITGPSDTPYANGCFLFDVCIPTDYPNVPPQFRLKTTGNDTVRFNPNLYEDGTVCLSILNTWHGRPEEQWDPKTSSLLQVLVSIQSLIFVSEPFYNEPGYEMDYGNPFSMSESRRYNVGIRAATVRWAMLDQLRNPSVGFEAVILNHFQLKKKEILSQIEEWIQDISRMTDTASKEHLKNVKEDLSALIKELSRLDDRIAACNSQSS